MSKRLNIPEKELKLLYEKQQLTTYQIAKKFDCCQATIWKKLISYNIKRRKPYELYAKIPSKKELIEFYIKNKLSTWKIEKKYGYSRGTVHRKLKKYGIKVRDRAKAHIIYKRKDFSGDPLEKAYLIGFKLGDLGVRKRYKNSKTVCLACSSTIPEQIDLIEKLFKKYGRVWIKKSKRKIIHCQVNLNESFDFLHTRKVPLWIPKNKSAFFSFLGGFVDAEGHIGIYQNMARFSLGNYNLAILKLIYNNLIKHGIKCYKLFSDKRKGKVNNEGYPYRNDYWCLRVHRKEELLKLFSELKPYLRHKNKIKALNSAIKNINQRNNVKLS